jgi:hypothetical protein
MQHIVHLLMLFGVPALAAWAFYNGSIRNTYLILISTVLVDLDQLLFNQVFEFGSCSINYFPLHSWPALLVYFLGLFFEKTRRVAMGLHIHMLADLMNCIWVYH